MTPKYMPRVVALGTKFPVLSTRQRSFPAVPIATVSAAGKNTPESAVAVDDVIDGADADPSGTVNCVPENVRADSASSSVVVAPTVTNSLAVALFSAVIGELTTPRFVRAVAASVAPVPPAATHSPTSGCRRR